MAFARTAPVAPATASPHGGIGASLDMAAMTMASDTLSLLDFAPRWMLDHSYFGTSGIEGLGLTKMIHEVSFLERSYLVADVRKTTKTT